jgi:cell division protein ZapA
MSEPDFLDVRILGREYRVACPPEARAALVEAVALVDTRMQEIAQKTRNPAPERVAVMAALNIAHECLQDVAAQKALLQAAFDSSDLRRRIEAMDNRLDAALASGT